MRRFVEEADRGQWTLLPECLDFIDESNPVRVIDVFVDALDSAEMSFEGIEPAATGRQSYHPSVLLKLYISGYLNRAQSSRRLEREARPPGLFHYVAAKAAIVAFTRCLALEIGTRNVNANCVAQGVGDIVPSYVFLASDEVRFYQGQCISPNGGDIFL